MRSYQVESLDIPPEVYREISQSKLLHSLADKHWIKVTPISLTGNEALLSDPDFASLGDGEKESILLALMSEESILLINDNKARKIAKKYGVAAFSVPDFLMACKEVNFLAKEEIGEIMEALKEKDFYGFKGDIEKLLLT
ncbi:MAG: hypothetical protein HY673_13315 [Chloroflexi bacterium]|nr:hypothetical protein [Chloroflexota bacterium]